MFWMREEAVTYKSPMRAWKEGARGSAGCVRILLVGKVQILCSSDHTRQRKGVQGPQFPLCVGCGLLFGSVFIAAECGTRSG